MKYYYPFGVTAGSGHFVTITDYPDLSVTYALKPRIPARL